MFTLSAALSIRLPRFVLGNSFCSRSSLPNPIEVGLPAVITIVVIGSQFEEKAKTKRTFNFCSTFHLVNKGSLETLGLEMPNGFRVTGFNPGRGTQVKTN